MLFGFDIIGLDMYQATDLMERMSEPQRFYHTVAHVADLLGYAGTDPLMIAAAWGHDIFYDPAARDNEQRSADFMAELLRGNQCGIDVDLLHTVITDTASHKATLTQSQRFSDIDMSILGTMPERYSWYRAMIRKEFNFVPWETFAKARADILERFNASTIYYTEEFAHLEAPAHANIINEVMELRMDEPTYMGKFL